MDSNKENNMKNKCIYLGVLVILFFATIANAANKQTKLYIYGVVTSFNDSTIYFTDIMELDSAWVDSKTGFLYSRDNYSYQLRNYMRKNGVAYPTCITSYARKRKDIEKKYAKVKKKYIEKKEFNIKYIPANEFKYIPIVPDDVVTEEKKK